MKKSTLALTLSLAVAPSVAQAAINILEKDQWKLGMNGFIETDLFSDSTRSFVEAPGNTSVQRGDTLNGLAGRTQFSVRNSRLGFTLEAPDTGSWKTKGVLEFDLLGYDPAPGASNTEASFFNNATMRIRHAYMSMENNGWQFTAGQTWQLLGFQPNYFIPSMQPVSVTGMIFGRATQVRAMKTLELSDDLKLQAGLGLMRPPQRDALTPGAEGGVRLILANRTAGFTTGSGAPEKTQPMSLAVSGAVREISTPKDITSIEGELSYHPGSALAIDTLIPILASGDGKDVGNTLMLGGEFTTGQGYGDSFLNWTGLQASPIATGSAASASDKAVNLDGGIGGYDAAGNFSLMKLESYNVHLQYHLPTEMHSWLNAGYGSIRSSNIGDLTNAEGKTGAASYPCNRNQVYFANVQHDLSNQVRVGFEFAHTRSDFSDGTNAHNNRYQLSAWFMF